MKHHKSMRTLGRERNQRRALLKSLSASLIEEKKIKTTLARARELRPVMDKLVTLSKKGNVNAIRLLYAKVGRDNAKKLVGEIAISYKDRNGGYTRIIKLNPRKSDGALMAQIEFV
ncbi:MAG: rplQ [Parcubacteria group bacterium]|nr:rplQ [Parcubacteria group bacterium]